ncbi:hypothetical protein IVA79_12505 [Bradyrhizobium sp. 138]|uniref:hypothetical protein n=1 Tax=Bradyrhizobium sp. 138 TaxID=2782615 RepID=UPI001FF76D90|nr:hypothetical protein [Bradyrhizobium sp. 138]MCK1734759.1 hypothetical protein [Bradyrhizobium sp. 138]
MRLVREMPSDWRTMSEEAQKRFITRIDYLCENTLKGIARAPGATSLFTMRRTT